MPTSDENHECILRHLSTPAFTNVRLVARLSDPAIGNADQNSAYFFVPDLHLVSNDWLPRYSYHFNEPASFYRMLFRLSDAAQEIVSKGGQVSTLQLGDLFDLWRDGDTTTPDRIIADNQHLVEMLYSHPSGLRARMLVGNHDVRMNGAPNWNVRLLLPNEQAGAFGLVTHGDWFDDLLHNVLPDWVQQFGVLMGGTIPQPNAYPVPKLLDVLATESSNAGGFASHIMLGNPAPLAGLCAPAGGLPREVNVARTSRGQVVHPFLPHAVSLLAHLRGGGAGFGPAWPSVRLVVVGHTHHARISVDDSNPSAPVVLVDCGAWIERYQEPNAIARPNCQLGVLSGNDVRIYQLDPQ